MSVGFYVETWGGGRYTAVAFFCTYAKAEAERQRIVRAGYWSGKPPRVSSAGC